MSVLISSETLFWFGIGIVGYTYVGYPCIVFLLGHFFPSRILKQPLTPAVTILIAAHNECERVGTKIENCLALDYPRDKLDLIVVSDGSSDRTEAVVGDYAHRYPGLIRLIALPARGGKANALNIGAAAAGGDILLLADVRQRFDLKTAKALATNFADPSVGAVTGELVLLDGETGETQKGLGLYWRIEKKLRSVETQFGSTIVYTGAVSAIRRSLFKPLPVDALTDDLIIPLRIMAQGFRVVFEPAAKAFDRVSDVPGREFSRKVRTLAGLFQTVANFRSYVVSLDLSAWWQFVSHKVLRLVVPYALVLALVSSAFANGLFYRIAMLAQLACYALGVLGLQMPNLAKQSRVVSAAAAFLMLHLAALIAPFRYLTSKHLDLWFRAPTDQPSEA